MRITVIGTGYVGLVSGVCFSEFGFQVTCVDRDSDKIAKLQQQIMPIYELGLEPLVESNRKAGRLSFTTNIAEATAQADIVLLAVGTPSNDTDGLPDLTALHAATKEVAQHLKGYTLIITKSTVPVGTNRSLAKMISQANPNADFDIASNPEFLREGNAVQDFMAPDRIVAGIDSKRAKDLIIQLYEPICLNGATLMFTTFESAEMIKYAANSMLAMRIAFINEISDLCEKTGANIREVSRGIGLDKRIGDKFLQPGPGFGGSCFPKDTLALKTLMHQMQSSSHLLDAVVLSNEQRKVAMAQRIMDSLGTTQGKTIAILGLTFKPETDDMRDSASLVIIPRLQEAGITIRAYDPKGMKEAQKHLTNVEYFDDPYSAMKGADGVVILTEWNEFRHLDLRKTAELLSAPLIIDLRNIYKRQDMKKMGFHYVSIGRQEVVPGEPWIADLNIENDKVA